MTAQQIIHVSDDTPVHELTEALAHCCAHAKRQMYLVEKFAADPPTAWTKAHRQINALLDDLERVQA